MSKTCIADGQLVSLELRAVARECPYGARPAPSLTKSARRPWTAAGTGTPPVQYPILRGSPASSRLLHSAGLSRPAAWRVGEGQLARRLSGLGTAPFHTSPHASTSTVHAVTGYAFAGKPRTSEAEEEQQRQYAGDDGKAASSTPDTSASKSQPRQGFPSNSTIGAWVDKTLRAGEAGEDALLFEQMKGEGDVIFGVADGVGGWSENGVDPALFSQSLMYHAAQYAAEFYACPDRLDAEDLEHRSSPPSGASSDVSTPLSTPPPASPTQSKASTAEPGTPLDVLQYAFQKTQEQKEVPAGSATACLVSFDSSKGVIRTANLGDSGFLVIRPGVGTGEEGDTSTSRMPTVHYQSKPQTHGFNTPLQLSKLPPEYRFDGSIDSKPSNADLWSGRVLDGDMVLVATDGFWDNVSVSEMLQLVQFIKDKHRVANVDRMLDISSNPLAEEQDLANVLAHK